LHLEINDNSNYYLFCGFFTSRALRDQKVVGSNPATSTAKALDAVWFQGLFILFVPQPYPNGRIERVIKEVALFVPNK